jgi:2'-hydroxyisoflavone reductase
MRLLVLGGTVFLGRHLVEAAVARRHEVTIFTRGEHPAPLPPGVEALHGNRDGALQALVGRRWDAAVDTSGYAPRLVRASARLLADAVATYTFISSISVYRDFAQAGLREDAPVATLDDPTTEAVTGETYGALKALCEQAAEEELPGRVLVVRPGLIVGPFDPTDRFTYWPHRLAAGGVVLAPGQPGQPVQFIDARDLASWTLSLVERAAVGRYHATGPVAPLTMGQLLEACRVASGSDARCVWVDEAFLAAQGVAPWTDLPLWVPDDDPQSYGFQRVDCVAARAAGLAFRPLDDTIRETLAWEASRPADHVWRAGLSSAREAELLAAWEARPS